MAELSDLLPMPPQFGPPLPSSFKVIWPWLKRPSQKEYVPPMAEAPQLVTASAPESKPAPVPVAAQRAINYEVESPPELLAELSPIRISPSWLQTHSQQ